MAEWQPIETAPKDGTEILIFYPVYRVAGAGEPRARAGKVDYGYDQNGVLIGSKIAVAYWYDSEEGHRSLLGAGYWQTLSGQNLGALAESDPTHWMPLPDPPEQAG